MTSPGGRCSTTVCAGLALALLGGLTPCAAPGAQENESDIRVFAPAPPGSDIRPGGQLTLSFRVVNPGPSRRTLAERIVYPRSWKILASDSMFTLQPAGSEVRLVTFHVPATAPAGVETIIYVLHDSASGEQASVTSLPIGVQTRRHLQVTPVESPRIAASGRPYAATFSLWMEGNSGGRVSLSAKSSGNYQVALDSSQFHLPPGESRLVNLSVKTPSGIPMQRRDLLTLSATIEGDSVPAATSTVAVDILPVDGETADFQHRVPSYVALRSAGEDGSAGVQGEVGISGPLLPDREGLIYALVRTPDLQHQSLLGPLDEYRIRYEDRNIDLVLGDHTYALSPLTELGRYAFGAGASVSLSEFTLGGFYNRTRLASRPQEEAALFAATDLTQAARLSFQAMGKEDPQRSGILSFRLLVRPMTNSIIDAEFGRSFGESSQDDALSLRWSERSALVYYDIRFMRSGAEYTGYFRDLDLKSANVVLYPWSLLRIELLLREEERNLGRDTLLVGAPRHLLYEAGAGFGNYVFARVRRRKLQDVMPDPLFGRDELTYLIRGGYASGGGSALAEAEFGTHREHVFAKDGPYSRIALFLNIFPAWFHSYGATLEYAHEPNLYNGEGVARWAGSITAKYILTPKTHLYVALQSNRVHSTPRQVYTAVEAWLDHEFNFGHVARIRARHSTFNLSPNGSDFSWMAEYSVPFGLPLGRISTVGGVSGRVVDAETGVGIPEVILSIAKRSVLTDRNGSFAFQGLEPGMHRLQVDVTTLGRHRVLEHGLNDPIPVHGGEDTPVELRVVRGGEIAGSVTLNTFVVTESGDTLANQFAEVAGIPSALIEASRGDDLVRQLTDSRGGFQFKDLRPGTWSIRVRTFSAPENHFLETEAVTVDVTGGEKTELTFRVLPRRRIIRILNQGELRQQ